MVWLVQGREPLIAAVRCQHQHVTHDPRTELDAGVTILDPALTPHGFVFHFQNAGRGSGGDYAWGKYVRDDRSLHLHHRWGLGIIEYHIADLWIDHDGYLKHLGVEKQSNVLWMPLESGLDRYRALRSDIERFCSDFLAGPAVDWASAATAEGHRRTERNRELNAGYVGDDRKRQQAHELFREERYADVVTLLDSLHYPDLLNQSEERMLHIARKRASGI